MPTALPAAPSARAPKWRPPSTQRAPAPGAFLLNFMVEKEDSVYPMIPVGAALHEMIRRPDKDPLLETPDDV